MRQSAVRALNCTKRRDFFGIQDITNKDIAGAFATKTKLPAQELARKYDALRGSRNRLVNEERDEDAVFGRIRYDSDNLIQKHGQYEEGLTQRLYDTIQVKQMFVPDSEAKSEEIPLGQVGATEAQSDTQYSVPYVISEVPPIQDISQTLKIFWSPDDDKRKNTLYRNQPPITFFFEDTKEAPNVASSQQEQVKSCKLESSNEDQPAATSEAAGSEPEYDLRRPQMDLDAQAGPDGARAPIHELDIMSEEYQERKEELNRVRDNFDRALDKRFDVVIAPEKPTKALEYLKKVRSREVEPTAKKLRERLAKSERPYSFKPMIKLDSLGFRIYTYQVPDWSAIRRIDMLSYIRNSIIYHNYDILAINKPYGLSCHASSSDPMGEDIDSLVRDVAKSMRIQETFLAHRLDKTTTGVLLFATSKERAQNLNKLFKSDEIKKTYWALTKGVPDPRQGIIDLPIGEFGVAGKMRRCPVQSVTDEEKNLASRPREARRAITQYRVIEAKANAALVELQPQSGVTHQLRCHLGFGLNTPILGDHKYSYIQKVAPQKLPPSLLKALHIRQSKVRTLPMHLHARSIVIPGAKANGETLFIHAPLPTHFKDNLKSLKLSYQDSKFMDRGT